MANPDPESYSCCANAARSQRLPHLVAANARARTPDTLFRQFEGRQQGRLGAIVGIDARRKPGAIDIVR